MSEETWYERKERLKREGDIKLRPIDWNAVKNKCPLCSLDLKRIPADYDYSYPTFNIYTCAMWKDVHHIALSNGYSQAYAPKIKLVRRGKAK